jgi:hypothetical protein
MLRTQFPVSYFLASVLAVLALVLSVPAHHISPLTNNRDKATLWNSIYGLFLFQHFVIRLVAQRDSRLQWLVYYISLQTYIFSLAALPHSWILRLLQTALFFIYANAFNWVGYIYTACD